MMLSCSRSLSEIPAPGKIFYLAMRLSVFPRSISIRRHIAACRNRGNQEVNPVDGSRWSRQAHAPYLPGHPSLLEALLFLCFVTSSPGETSCTGGRRRSTVLWKLRKLTRYRKLQRLSVHSLFPGCTSSSNCRVKYYTVKLFAM